MLLLTGQQIMVQRVSMLIEILKHGFDVQYSIVCCKIVCICVAMIILDGRSPEDQKDEENQKPYHVYSWYVNFIHTLKF